MFQKKDTRLLHTLERLRGTQDCQQFLEWLESELKHLDKNSRHMNGEELLKNLGRAQMADGLLELFNSAKATIDLRSKSNT